MPKEFENCVKNGGRVRTKKLKNGRYMKICYDKNGNSHPGEIKKKKQASKDKKIEEAKTLQKKLVELRDYFNSNYSSKHNEN